MRHRAASHAPYPCSTSLPRSHLLTPTTVNIEDFGGHQTDGLHHPGPKPCLGASVTHSNLLLLLLLLCGEVHKVARLRCSLHGTI